MIAHTLPVHGLDLYAEDHNAGADGTPLVLLHGNLSTLDVDFAALLPMLSERRRVIGIEQQAHGHTPDTDRPLTIAQMADDTAEALRQLGVERADVFGFSNGAAIALHLAVEHPSFVRKLVLGSPLYRKSGFHEGILEGAGQIQPEHLHGTPFHEGYLRVAPRPKDFPRLVARGSEVDQSFPEWTEEEIRSIEAPALLLVGDSDVVRPEHAVEVFRLFGGGVAGDVVGLPDSRLAVLPGTTHVGLMRRAAWIGPMVNEFLGTAKDGEAGEGS